MQLIKINFLNNEVAIITALVGKMPSVFHLDTIINKGLTLDEWINLRNILENNPPNTSSVNPDEDYSASLASIIKKIDIASKQQ